MRKGGGGLEQLPLCNSHCAKNKTFVFRSSSPSSIDRSIDTATHSKKKKKEEENRFVFAVASATRNSGDAEYRSPYLSHAKRALYHLSYIPW